MGIGTSLFLIALGAILRYAVQDAVPGVALGTVGVILMVVGVVGLLISLLWANLWGRNRGDVAEERTVVRRDRDVY
jgi:hypothetical protein